MKMGLDTVDSGNERYRGFDLGGVAWRSNASVQQHDVALRNDMNSWQIKAFLQRT